MILSENHQYTYNHKYYNELNNLCILSKNLYNATLYAIRQHFFNTHQYLNYTKVNKIFVQNNQVDYRKLPAKVAQQTQRLVDNNFKSFFALLKNNVKAKIPKYLKKDGRQVVQYTKQALSFKKDGYIQLSGTNIFIKTKIDKQYIQAARIVPYNGYIKVEIIYKCTVKNINSKENKNIASIDLGLNNLMAITFTNHSPIIINGKPLKHINQYYNKEYAYYQSKLIQYQQKYTSKRLECLTRKRNNKINDYLHKSVNILMNQLVTNDISTLILGYNKDWKQDINIGKRNNQNFVQIPFYKLKQMITYKCELYGIKLIIQEESYTSKCSFIDREEICKHEKYAGNRIRRGLFKTSTGRYVNADVNGSLNIMKKAVGDIIYSYIVDPIEACSMPSVITVKH